MSENKDNKLTLINEKTANDYLTHTFLRFGFPSLRGNVIIIINKLRADLNESAEDAEAISFDDSMEDVKELANATQRLKDHKIHVVTCAKAYTSAIGVPYHPPFIK